MPESSAALRTGAAPAKLSPSRKAFLAFWDNITARITAYYAVLLSAGWVLYGLIPKDAYGVPTGPFAELLGAGAAQEATGKLSKKELMEMMVASTAGSGASKPTDIALSTFAAMISAVVLSIPVSWTYMYTKRKKGYAQATVQSLLILPLVIAGAAMLLKHSVALAFGLGAIAAAIKFRSSVDDTKDAAFIFLGMTIGLAAGVEIAVATMISVFFVYTVLILWYLDFGRTPARLEGELARRRLERATAIANRTGAFVAKLDEEVLKALAPEQLEALAERARKRKDKLMKDEAAGADGGTGTTGESAAAEGDIAEASLDAPATDADTEQLLRIFTPDPIAARPVVEALLGEYLVDWRFVGAAQADGTHWIEYAGRLAPSVIPPTVLYDVRTRSAPHVIRCELKPRGPRHA